MSRTFTTLIAAIALSVTALAVEPASAMPVSGASVLESSSPASAVEQVRFFRGGPRRGFGLRRGYGFRRGYGYRGGYGYRRGLPGHPIRRILRAL